jgi:hypothetical protein
VEGFGQINSYSKGYKPDVNLDAFLNLCPEVIDQYGGDLRKMD